VKSVKASGLTVFIPSTSQISDKKLKHKDVPQCSTITLQTSSLKITCYGFDVHLLGTQTYSFPSSYSSYAEILWQNCAVEICCVQQYVSPFLTMPIMTTGMYYFACISLNIQNKVPDTNETYISCQLPQPPPASPNTMHCFLRKLINYDLSIL
jgi:hypothetical protein